MAEITSVQHPSSVFQHENAEISGKNQLLTLDILWFIHFHLESVSI